MNIYLELTQQFNDGARRVIVSSGQAVVLHRLAIMSKDGDWIVRETPEALAHILSVLSVRGARYRFGAPLDVRWLAHGWTSHFEFQDAGLRVRTDFCTRPPRLSDSELKALWHDQAHSDPPVVDLVPLANLKKTNREKDYAVIGELARAMPHPRDQMLYSRSARDLIELAQTHAALAAELIATRPLLATILKGRDALEKELDAERRALMHANEQRLRRYLQAAEPWAQTWSSISSEVAGLPLLEAHARILQCAERFLPFETAEGTNP